MLRKERTMNGFTYVWEIKPGLTTTVIEYQDAKMLHPIVYEIRNEYTCLCCRTTYEITSYKNGVTIDAQTKFYVECASESLCPACMCGTDQAIEGAAESLMALIN